MTHYHVPDRFLDTLPCAKFGSYNFKDKGVTAGGGNTTLGWSET